MCSAADLPYLKRFQSFAIRKRSNELKSDALSVWQPGYHQHVPRQYTAA